MPVGGQNNYPSLNEIANLVRSYVNDDKAGATGTPGEGQIIPNTSVTMQNLMNSGIREIYRKIRIMGQPTLIKDNFVILGLPPVNSPLGVAAMNPAVQVAIQFAGYFDGLQMYSNLGLPNDLIMPLEMWERQAGTTNPFGMMRESTGALAPRNQTQALGDWEWRTDSIWMNGATQSRDVRIRYIANFLNLASPTIDWTQTFVPVLDSQEAIADTICVRYGRRLGAATIEDVKAQARASVLDLKQQVARRRQMIDYQRPSYGNGAASMAGNPASFLY